MNKIAFLLVILGVCAAESAIAAERSGDVIFGATCTACHSAGVMGAPKFGSASAWAPHIAKGNATLYSHAIHGFNSMPAKGGCGDCTDAEIKGAVDYMVSQAK